MLSRKIHILVYYMIHEYVFFYRKLISTHIYHITTLRQHFLLHVTRINKKQRLSCILVRVANYYENRKNGSPKLYCNDRRYFADVHLCAGAIR